MKFLAEDVLRNTRSTEFSFQEKLLNDQDINLILKLIQLNCEKIEKLSIQDNNMEISPQTIEILHHFPALDSLKLGGNKFGNKTLQSLNTALKTLTLLQELNLANCHLNQSEILTEIMKILGSCCKKLSFLDLSQNGGTIDADVARHLVEITAMKELNLKGNKFTGEGLRELANGAEFMFKLQVLNLNDCEDLDSSSGLLDELKNKFCHVNELTEKDI